MDSEELILRRENHYFRGTFCSIIAIKYCTYFSYKFSDLPIPILACHNIPAIMVQNKGVIYRSHPKGFPQDGDLVVEAREIDLSSVPEGGVIIKNHVVSFDPYMRGRMRSPEIKSYSPAFTLNQPISSAGISKVIKSDNANFKEGDIVKGRVSMEEYTAIPAAYCGELSKLENPHNLPLRYFVGALGMPGLTA